MGVARGVWMCVGIDVGVGGDDISILERRKDLKLSTELKMMTLYSYLCPGNTVPIRAYSTF